ncbi:MAG TPA: FtsX-like permease family protein [Kofleriaceae bacterium]|nr:FtsX-like permease family protein [Kofleriaceae bacterium]
MHFVPILSTLRRHKTAALLVVLEIALTCAIVCNAVFLIRTRLERMNKVTGIAESEIVDFRIAGIGVKKDEMAQTMADMAALRAIPGVKLVASTNMIPFGGSSWNNGVSLNAEQTGATNSAVYLGTDDLVETLGVKIIAGRDFTPDEYQDFDAVMKDRVHYGSVLVTQGLAQRLFPGQNALGKQVYTWGKQPQTIVGIVERLARPNDANGLDIADCAFIAPVRPAYTVGAHYLMRVEPARAHAILNEAETTLMKLDPARLVLGKQTFAEVREDYFKQDRAMAFLLVGVSLALLVITGLGIVGLASFWVQQRTRQIGIRRALGATRGNILRYFQLENFILATIGIVLGMALAYAMNLWLMHKYQVPRLPGSFLPIGAGLLWLLGQLAVLGPAMRASMIAPATATRSV